MKLGTKLLLGVHGADLDSQLLGKTVNTKINHILKVSLEWSRHLLKHFHRLERDKDRCFTKRIKFFNPLFV